MSPHVLAALTDIVDLLAAQAHSPLFFAASRVALENPGPGRLAAVFCMGVISDDGQHPGRKGEVEALTQVTKAVLRMGSHLLVAHKNPLRVATAIECGQLIENAPLHDGLIDLGMGATQVVGVIRGEKF